MKLSGLVIALMAGFIINFPVTANDDFNSGMNYARGLKGKELDTFKSFKPAENLPDYSSSPDATKYYGGVKSTGVDLTSPGRNTLNDTAWGKAVTGSVSRQPKDMVTADSPFLDNGRNAGNNAQMIFDPKLCKPATFDKSVFTHYVCERDLQVQQYCTRSATVTGNYVTDEKNIVVILPPSAFTYEQPGKKLWGWHVASTETGVIQEARLIPQGQGQANEMYVDFMNTHFRYSDAVSTLLNAAGEQVQKGQVFSGTGCTAGSQCTSAFARVILDNFRSGVSGLSLKLTLRVHYQKWVPQVIWSENCPFDKAEGSLTGTECTQPGGDRTVTVDGNPYTVHQDCWAYRDSYLTQSESEGTCGAYIHNAACNVVSQQCVDQGDGACLHADITYSCETKMKGEGQVCGNELFCTDGSCVLDNSGKNDMFVRAVSQLAAVAAAGRDVAGLNSHDVKIFTGSGVSCKKFAAGFSNCCKDSGWGQDVGLASCSSDEKALGKAKEKRLTVYVGEYCSKKVPGICLEKKRGYCEFASKLAQIVQQQGRSWQLGMGFGSGKSPDCRGITPEELQRIDFSKVDFSAFYDDLNSGSAVPSGDSQMTKMKARMKAMFDQGSSH